MRAPFAVAAMLTVVACSGDATKTSRAPTPTAAVPLLHELRLPKPPANEPDGADIAPVTTGPNLRRLATASSARLVALDAPPPTRHPVVCDILGFAGALYVSHAVEPIGKAGARIHRFDLSDGVATRWQLAFDWDRTGAKPDFIGGIGGEGITRLRIIDGRIYAADSDTPGPGGFGRSKARYEDYLFVSDANGRFGPLQPGMTPPTSTKVLPMSFHAFDVIRYRGALVASGGTGSYPTGPYPGALWVGNTTDRVLPVRFELGANLGVVRTTFMHRFRGRLYVGFQNNWRRGGRPVKFDLAVLTGDPRAAGTPRPVLARVTPRGGWLTRRFASGKGTLYWLASRYRDNTAAVFESSDGLRFRRVPLPAGSGEPQDIAVVGDTRYLLTTTGVYRSTGQAPFVEIARAPKSKPFSGDDVFCSAPLVAYGDRLFAGSVSNGMVYEVRVPASTRSAAAETTSRPESN